MASTTDGIPEHLSCPVCFEVPDSEVYQCLDGHVLCKKCYFQLSECPQCRIPLDATRPIRNRYFEGLLDSIKVKCEYLFCDTKVPKSAIRSHMESCCHNKKFGEFIKLCNLMGLSDCQFEVNNGNTEDAVQHFVSTHGCLQSKGQQFQMELTDIEAALACKETSFWTPIISNLSDKQCFILTMAVLDKGSVAFLSFFLPYNENPNRNNPSVKISFTVSYGDPKEPFVWTSTHVPVQLTKAYFYLPSNIPSPFQLPWLQSHSMRRDSFVIDCKIMPKDCIGNGGDAEEGKEKIVSTKYSSVSSLILPEEDGRVVDWNGLERTPIAQEMLDKQLKSEENKDRGEVFAFIKNVFEGDLESFPGIVKGDMEWLRYGCYFLAANYGTVNAIQYILNKGLNCNVINPMKETPLFWTMYDENQKIGLRKAKLLVEQGGADAKIISSNNNQSMLHRVARFGTPEALKYFLELGLNVNERDGCGRTPFQSLVENRARPGNEEEFLVKMAKMFLDSGTNCNLCNVLDINVLEMAEMKSLEKIQKMIISQMN